VAIRTTEPAEKRHHSFSLAQRQVRLEYEACVPTGGGRLKPLVFLVSKLKEQEQGVREHHERMFAHADSNASAPQSRARLGLGSVPRRSSGAELAGGTGGAEEGHLISAIVIEVDEVALPARSGADGATLTIATDEV
jgi:hypothetical protein